MEGNISRTNSTPHHTQQFSKITNDEEKKAESAPKEKVTKDTFERTEIKTGKENSSEIKEYTILAYMDGSNNLEEALLEDVKEMENCMKKDNYNIAVQFSRFQTSGLTTAFFGEALSQAFGSNEFKGLLGEIVPDRELLEKYGELLKDSSMCQRIATILLRRNPSLNDRMDKFVTSKIRETSKDSKDMNNLISDTISEMLTQIKTFEDKREANTELYSTNLADIMDNSADPRTILKDIISSTGKFINGTEGISDKGTKPGLMDAAAIKGEGLLQSDRGGILFSDMDQAKLHQGDYGKILKYVDKVEKDNEPKWRGVRRYELSPSEDPSRINSKPIANLGFKDMSKIKSLAEFIEWGIKKYPAKHYIVLLSDHGAGFLGAEEDRGNMLSLPDIREAFAKAEEKTGKKPDILAFDACLMSQAEVAYELKDAASYLIGSEEVVGGDGYPYRKILPRIDEALEKGKSDPRDIASIFIEEGEKVNESSTFTLSAIDLKRIDNLVNAADNLAKHILEGKADLEAVRESLKGTQHYSVNSAPMEPYIDYRDLWDLADKMEKNPKITNKTIKNDLKNLKKAVEKAVVKEEHKKDEDYEGSHGISIYAPRRQKTVSIPLMKEYEKTMMAKESNWDEFIKKLNDYDSMLKEAEGAKEAKMTLIQLPQRK